VLQELSGTLDLPDAVHAYGLVGHGGISRRVSRTAAIVETQENRADGTFDATRSKPPSAA